MNDAPSCMRCFTVAACFAVEDVEDFLLGMIKAYSFDCWDVLGCLVSMVFFGLLRRTGS